MQTSFALWLEARDPELFIVLEAEWNRRGRSPVKRGVIAGAAAAAALAGLGWWMSGDKTAEKPAPRPDTRAKVVHVKPVVEEEGEPGQYKGSDKEAIFRYACQQTWNGVNIFPYEVGGKQEGLIARMSLPATTTSPLRDKDLKDSYYTFVKQIRATMKGRNVFRVHPSVAGQGPVTWEYIAIGRDNPNRSEAGMVEIVLYAKKPAGER